MSKSPLRRKLRDAYCFPGFIPGLLVRGVFGDPLARDVDQVERDLNLGYVSRETAEQVYGAVVATAAQLGDRQVFTLDRAATARQRGGG